MYLKELCDSLVENALKKIKNASSEDVSQAQIDVAMFELKNEAIERLCDKYSVNRLEFVTQFPDLPNIVIAENYYNTRFTLLSRCITVFLGLFIGNLLSTILNIIDLGGGFLQFICILTILYFSDYFAANDKIRTRILTALGLASVGRLALSITSAITNFGFFGIFRSSTFSILRGNNIFYNFYVVLATIFAFVFFSRTKPEFSSEKFAKALELNLNSWLNFVSLLLDKQNINYDKKQTKSDICPKNDCKLALNLIPFVQTLDENEKIWLSRLLADVGYVAQNGNSIIWNSSEHAHLYNKLGLIEDGDKCIVLNQAILKDDEIHKGYVQKSK